MLLSFVSLQTTSSEPSDNSFAQEDDLTSQDSSLVTDGELLDISESADIGLEDEPSAQDDNPVMDSQLPDSSECAEETPEDSAGS